jgi:hypothetical protein
MAFALQLVKALDSEEVQEKIFNTVLRPVLGESLASLAAKVGEVLANTKHDHELRLHRLQGDFDKYTKEASKGVTKPMQSEEVTLPVEATSSSTARSTRNRARKFRRSSLKAKHVYEKSKLLSLRINHNESTSGDVHAAESHGFPLAERIANLETVVLSQVAAVATELQSSDVDWEPWQSAVSAEVLARECAAVRLIQNAWRRSQNRQRDRLFADLCATIVEPSFTDQLFNVLYGADLKRADAPGDVRRVSLPDSYAQE